MAPSTPDAVTPALSMKLLVDTKAGRVLYAEASKDVVDFLFSLLTLPVGTVVKILSKDAMVGSVGNLYGSVEELDETYVRSDYAKDALLAPAGGCSGGKLLRLPEPEQPAPTQFYRCNYNSYTECITMMSEVYNTPCQHRSCSGKMTTEMKIVTSSSTGRSGRGAAAVASAVARTGFVQSVVTYTVMDDLKVAPMSTISGITLLNTFGITDIGSLSEKIVQLGYTEGLEILRVSLQSKTVLTDVFLGKKRKA
ncbi:uncharacterized protein LOC8059130 [Sorghum bicolor]|uniref:DUF674 domain-containing protein n=1 Tax=Sorghum bicolor TaxID=4558 RepID=C5XPB2_SORBI|nr:uncharacterized protein LOC8059130 [Sorghum bicolor]EES00299.1 hypothetical protein SORBI_3003G065800 [Sorghum bicolor]|eukprot:XP_002455179.1 uncharacterized protein LOC8059130 [Sorghum bicolor]